MEAKNMHLVGEYEWGTVYTDEHDSNAGGASHDYVVSLDGGGRCEIQFQHGPRKLDTSIQGILDEHLLMIVADRMRAFQDGPFSHPANASVLAHVEAASAALRERAEERRKRGVLGTNQK